MDVVTMYNGQLGAVKLTSTKPNCYDNKDLFINTTNNPSKSTGGHREQRGYGREVRVI